MFQYEQEYSFNYNSKHKIHIDNSLQIQQNQIEKLYPNLMQPKPSPDIRYPLMKRKPSAGPKRPPPNSQPGIAEQHQEFDPKEYRMLVHCFATNISTYYNKKHKSLLGDLEDLYKIPLNKQQKHFLQENLQAIIDRNIGKIARDMLFRNSTIYKNINQYAQLYQKYNNKFQNTSNSIAPTDTHNIYSITEQNKQSHPFSNTQQQDKNYRQLLKLNNQLHQQEPQRKYSQKLDQSYTQGRQRPSSGYNRPIHSYNYGYYNKKSIDKGGSQSGFNFKNKQRDRDNYLSLNGHNFSSNNNWNVYIHGFSNIITTNVCQLTRNIRATQNQQAGQVFIRQNFRKSSNRMKHNNLNYTNTSTHYKNRKINNQQFILPLYQQNLHKYREGQQYNTIRVGDENSMMENNNIHSQQNIGNETSKDVSLSLTKNRSKEFCNSRSVNINAKGNRFFNEKYQLSSNFHNIPSCSNTSNLTHSIGYNLNLNLNSWSNRPKSIGQVEKQKWQTKILSMNGVLSANIVKPQGYKPKSKCWGTTVVASGKIVDKANSVAKQTINQPGKLLFSMMRYKS